MAGKSLYAETIAMVQRPQWMASIEEVDVVVPLLNDVSRVLGRYSHQLIAIEDL